MATVVFTSLNKIATREVPLSDLGGPIAIHDALDAGVIAYCPLAYQFTGYSHLAWANAPDLRGVLGGRGLAVSSSTRDKDAVRA